MRKKRPVKLGRPTVMTPEILDKLVEAFALGCGDKEACLLANIGMSTLYSYQETDPAFVERKHALKENPILKARKTVMDDIGNVDTAKWLLERKKKDEFSLRTELTGKDGNPVELTAIKQVSDEELYKLTNENYTIASEEGVSVERISEATPS
jgi:hypothetical protein